MESVFLMLVPITIGLILQLDVALGLNIRGGLLPKVNETTKGQGSNPLIVEACASAPYKDLCIETLKIQPGSATADLKNLAFLSLNTTKTQGSEVAEWVANKLEDQDQDNDSMGPGIEQAITDCNDQYTDAMAQLEDSLVAFFSNAYKDVKTWMTTAMNNAKSCQDSLKKGNADDVMGNKNMVFMQHCSNALAVIDVLALKH